MFCCHHDRAKGNGNLPIIEYKSLFCSLLNPTTGRFHKIWSTSKAKNLATRCWMITEKMLMHCVSNLFILIDDNTALCKLKGSYSWWQTMKNQNQKLRKWRSVSSCSRYPDQDIIIIWFPDAYIQKTLRKYNMKPGKPHGMKIQLLYTRARPSIRTFYSLCSEQTED
jgi:hypothetical protein